MKKLGRGLIVALVLATIGIVLLSVGISGLASSFTASPVKSQTALGGMLLGWSNSTAVQNQKSVASIQTPWVQMTIDVVRRNVRLEVYFWSRFSKSHALAMVLPFRTSGLTLLQNESIGGTVSSGVLQNITQSSSVVGCTWTDLRNYSDWASGGAVLSARIAGDIVSSQRGEDELYLPIGVYPPNGIVQEAQKYLPTGTTFPSPSSNLVVNFTRISLIVPADSKVEQLIPPGNSLTVTPAGLAVDLTSGLFGSATVIMDYHDVAIADAYQNSLISGGIWTASGSVLTAVGAVFAIRWRGSKERPDLLLSESARRLASVMFMDIVGYSGITHADEGIALRLLREQRDLVRPHFQKHNGREIKTIGDGVLVEFASALDAVTCAFEIQTAIHDSNSSKGPQDRILMRIGIHLGDVIHTRNDVFGDAVNLASRVEPVAPAGGVAFTRQVYEEIKNKVRFPILELGPHKLKNIGDGYELFRIVFPWEGESPASTAKA